MLVVAEGPEKGVQDKVGEIKDRFGIDLEFTALAVGPLLEKANQSLNADEGTFDIINVLGFSVSQMVGGDKFEQLNAYLDDPAKTPPDFDFADYPPGQTEYVGYFDVANGSFGGESLYLIPGLHGGSVITFYRKDLLEEAGLEPPSDPDSWLAAIEALNKDDVAGNSMIAKSGDVSLFLVDFWTRFTALGGELMSGSPQTKDFTPNLTGAESVARAAAHDRLREVRHERRHAVRLHGLRRRLRGRQDRDDAHVGHDRRHGLRPEPSRRSPTRSTSPCRWAASPCAAAGASASPRTPRTRTPPGP